MYRVSDVHFGARIYPKIYKSGARRTMSMMDHFMSCFWEDLREFAEKEKMAKNKENKK